MIDASNPEWRDQAEVVEKLIRQLGAEQTPRIDVFNNGKSIIDIIAQERDAISFDGEMKFD